MESAFDLDEFVGNPSAVKLKDAKKTNNYLKYIAEIFSIASPSKRRIKNPCISSSWGRRTRL